MVTRVLEVVVNVRKDAFTKGARKNVTPYLFVITNVSSLVGKHADLAKKSVNIDANIALVRNSVVKFVLPVEKDVPEDASISGIINFAARFAVCLRAQNHVRSC